HNSMFANNEIELSASKMSDSTNVLAIASMRSENQALGPHLKTHDLLAEGVWNNSYINFGLDADQVNQTNNVRVKGIVDFLADSTTIRMEPSSLRLLEREWSFKRDNFIKIKNNGWRFYDVALVNGRQSISLDGIVSDNPAHELSLDVESLDLSLLNVLTNKRFTGVMDANVKMRNFYGDRTLENDINISGLNINEFLI